MTSVKYSPLSIVNSEQQPKNSTSFLETHEEYINPWSALLLLDLLVATILVLFGEMENIRYSVIGPIACMWYSLTMTLLALVTLIYITSVINNGGRKIIGYEHLFIYSQTQFYIPLLTVALLVGFSAFSTMHLFAFYVNFSDYLHLFSSIDINDISPQEVDMVNTFVSSMRFFSYGYILFAAGMLLTMITEANPSYSEAWIAIKRYQKNIPDHNDISKLIVHLNLLNMYASIQNKK